MGFDSVILDSSAVIAYYNTEDAHHTEALRGAEVFRNKKTVLHPFVIQEVATVLTYRFGFRETGQFFADIRDAGDVVIPPVQIEKDIAFFERAGKKMSFTDLTLIRLSQELNAPLFTFDRQILSFLQSMR